MKKLVSLLVCILCTITVLSPALAIDIDLTEFTTDELIALQTDIANELTSRRALSADEIG